MLVPVGDIKSLPETYEDKALRRKRFLLRSPLTNEWSEFEVTDKHLAANCFPNDVLRFVSYYEDILKIQDLYRDLQPMKDDLRAMDDEEARTFGLRSINKEYIKLLDEMLKESATRIAKGLY